MCFPSTQYQNLHQFTLTNDGEPSAIKLTVSSQAWEATFKERLRGIEGGHVRSESSSTIQDRHMVVAGMNERKNVFPSVGSSMKIKEFFQTEKPKNEH